jgi:hypothetical protein
MRDEDARPHDWGMNTTQNGYTTETQIDRDENPKT